MDGWIKHFELKAKQSTGLSSDLVVVAAIAAVAAVMAFVFLCVTAFVWLEQIYSGVVAGLVLTGFFLVVALIAVAVAVASRRRNIEQARIELAQRHTALLDPAIMRMGVQVAQTIGWRRIVPLVAAGVLAAGLAAEWRKERTQAE
jgi:hypothetical protein